MAEYLVLLYEDESHYETADKEELDRVMEAHNAFGQAAGAAMRGGNGLAPTSTATSIRKEIDGQFTVTDGPFAETKEALGGYYVLEAADLDEAIALAKQIPVYGGGVEVRPIMVYS